MRALSHLRTLRVAQQLPLVGGFAVVASIWGETSWSGRILCLALLAIAAFSLYDSDPYRALDQSAEAPRWLAGLVERLCLEAGVDREVSTRTYKSDVPQAFCFHRNVAPVILFSSGLLERPSRQVIEAIAAHEIAHLLPAPSPSRNIWAQLLFSVAVVSFVLSALCMALLKISLSDGGLLMLLPALLLVGALAESCRRSRELEIETDLAATELVGSEAMIAAREWSHSLAASPWWLWPLHFIMHTRLFSAFATHPSPAALKRALERH